MKKRCGTSLATIFLIIATLSVSCSESELIQEFAIYLVKSEVPAEIHKDIFQYIPLESLELAEKPIFTDKDIVRYIWQSHEIIITEEAAKRIPEPPGVSSGIHCVVVVNNERCYLAAFWNVLSSFVPHFPTICIIPPVDGAGMNNSKNTNVLRIFRNLHTEEDIRFDPRIRGCLEALGKLEE